MKYIYIELSQAMVPLKSSNLGDFPIPKIHPISGYQPYGKLHNSSKLPSFGVLRVQGACRLRILGLTFGRVGVAKFHKPGSVKYLSFCLVLYIFYIK